MAIQRPTAEQLQELASRLHISLTPAQAEEYLAVMQANFDAYDLIDSFPTISRRSAIRAPPAIVRLATKIRSMPGITKRR
jgi:hypothetical protein